VCVATRMGLPQVVGAIPANRAIPFVTRRKSGRLLSDERSCDRVPRVGVGVVWSVAANAGPVSACVAGLL
jgi:hypothetical protein